MGLMIIKGWLYKIPELKPFWLFDHLIGQKARFSKQVKLDRVGFYTLIESSLVLVKFIGS
jgi:hypothetical protein